MTNITTQGLVDLINSNTIEKIDIDLAIAIKEQELKTNSLYLELQELKLKSNELGKKDNELREQGKELLISAGIKKFEALDGTIIQLNKKPGALIIENENNIELDNYWKEKVTRTIDKKQLKEDIAGGVVIDGVYMSEDYSLVIKNK